MTGRHTRTVNNRVVLPEPGSEPESWRGFILLWLRIGALSFGGPAGQIALLHRELVERRGWFDEAIFLRALNFCMLLPGPEAQQLATWCGWRRRCLAGGLVAGLAFVLPGALVMAGLAALYLNFGRVAAVQAAFGGIQAVVLAVVAQALARVAGRALGSSGAWAIASAAFLALFVFGAPFPAVVLVAGALGWWLERGLHPGDDGVPQASWRASVATAALWAGIWAAPLVGLSLWLGGDHAMVALGTFFARLAAISFGGAYAAMSYVAQAAVMTHHWLTPPEMLDGLGLAETTPGPLVLVFQFVGGLAGARIDGPWSATGGAALGMALVVWVTFAPSFLWIFALGPHLERLTRRPALAGALRAITAAVVGVMANLALWFALHVLFAEVVATRFGPFRLWVPAGGFDWQSMGIALGASALLTRTRAGLGGVLVFGAAIGLVAWRLNGG